MPQDSELQRALNWFKRKTDLIADRPWAQSVQGNDGDELQQHQEYTETSTLQLKNIYNLIRPEMLYVKYRPSFFYWTDIFLTSTHMPAYLVAAFAKKLARLALIAPVDAILIIIPIIGNILVRHPSLLFLINKKTETQVDTDPYDANEEDPAKSNALESSLWELRTLLDHWDPRVVEKASFIKNPLPTEEWDLSEILETTLDELKEETYSSIKKDDYDFNIDQTSREPLKKFVKFVNKG